MNDSELEALEQDLALVSDGLAAERSWEAVADGLGPILRRPYQDLFSMLALVAGFGLWGLSEPRAAAVAIAILIVFVPERLRAARERRERIARQDEDLFAQCAEDVRHRFGRDVLVTAFSLPMAFALLAISAVAESPEWPLGLAGLLLLYLPYHVVVRLRRTASEMTETRRWTDSADSVEGADQDDEAEESWFLLFAGILLQLARLGITYLGPIVFLAALVGAWGAEDPAPSLAAAGGVALTWILVRIFGANSEESDA